MAIREENKVRLSRKTLMAILQGYLQTAAPGLKGLEVTDVDFDAGTTQPFEVVFQYDVEPPKPAAPTPEVVQDMGG